MSDTWKTKHDAYTCEEDDCDLCRDYWMHEEASQKDDLRRDERRLGK